MRHLEDTRWLVSKFLPKGKVLNKIVSNKTFFPCRWHQEDIANLLTEAKVERKRKWNSRSLKERAAEVVVAHVDKEEDLRLEVELELPKTLLPLLQEKFWHREYFFF